MSRQSLATRRWAYGPVVALVGVLLLPTIGMLAGAGGEAPKPTTEGFVLEQATVDLGRQAAGGILEHSFPFRIVGERSVELADVRPSCGCLKPEVKLGRYIPGQTGAVTLRIHSAGQAAGVHQYQLALLVHDPQPRTVLATARIELFTEIEVAPSNVMLYAKDEAQHSATFAVRDKRPNPTTIVETSVSSDHLSVEPVPPPPDLNDVPAGLWAYRVTIQGSYPEGVTEERVTLRTSDPTYPEIVVPILIHRPSRFRVLPDRLVIFTDDFTDGPLTRLVHLRDAQGEAIAVRGVRSDTAQITATWPEAATPRAEIKLTVTGPAATLPASGTLQIEIAAPVTQTLLVPFERR